MDTLDVRVTLKVPVEIVLEGVPPGDERKEMLGYLRSILQPYGITVNTAWFATQSIRGYRKEYMRRILEHEAQEEPA